MVFSPQGFKERTVGYEQMTAGLWTHRGKFVVASGPVELPVGSINTYEIAVGACQAMEGYYAQAINWTLPVTNVWTESPIQATGTFEGFVVRVEFNFGLSCPTKGQRVLWGVMIDGGMTAIGAIGGMDAPEMNYAVMATGTYYVDPANDPINAGPHRIGMALYGPSGAALLGGIHSTLFLTEQKR